VPRSALREPAALLQATTAALPDTDRPAIPSLPC
jgi:hypothetical protein